MSWAVPLAGRPADLRLLEVLESNLLANREGWGKTNGSEWTNTQLRAKHRPSDPYRYIVGDHRSGGAGYATSLIPEGSLWGIGFRTAVVLGSEQQGQK
jgi:hypothetical protein